MKTLLAVMIGLAVLAGCAETNEQASPDRKEAASKPAQAAKPEDAVNKSVRVKGARTMTARIPWNKRYGVVVQVRDDIILAARIVEYSKNGEIIEVPQSGSVRVADGQTRIVFDEHKGDVIGVASYEIAGAPIVRGDAVYVSVSGTEIEVRDMPSVSFEEVDGVLQRLSGAYAGKKNIPPDDYRKNPDMKRLLALADQDVNAVLAAVQYGWDIVVINPMSFKQWKLSHDGVAVVKAHGPGRSRQGYDAYLDECRRSDRRRVSLPHKASVVLMMLKKKMSDAPDYLEELLRHSNISVRRYAAEHLAVVASGGGDVVASTTRPDSQPVVEYWDGGIHMLGKPPSVIFAAWSDGTVVKKVDRKTMLGSVSPEAISKLVLAVKVAGFFTPSDDSLLDRYGMVFPDGPVRCLSAFDGGKRRTLYYHEMEDRNRHSSIGPGASPSRRQRAQFTAMWRRVVGELKQITPDKLETFTGDRPLTYPKYTGKF